MSPVSPHYLSIGGGLKETQAVPKAFAGETQLDLFFKNGGGALEHHMVSLWGGGEGAKEGAKSGTANIIILLLIGDDLI